MRARSGRVVKFTLNEDFKYSFMHASFNLSGLLVTSALGAHLYSTPLTLKALETHLLLMPSTSSFLLSQNHCHSIFLYYLCALAVSTKCPISP